MDGPSDAARRARLFFAATIAGIALYVVLDAIAQSLPPHYSPISQAESDLAVGPYGYVMAVNFVNRGVLSLLFVYGLAKSLPRKAGFGRGLALLGIWGAGALVLAVEPTDVGGPATVHGVIHLIVATLAFLAAALGTLSLSSAFRREPSMESIVRYARPLWSSPWSSSSCSMEGLSCSLTRWTRSAGWSRGSSSGSSSPGC